ncbi:zf-HC2 domain-containing protein [Candidatus Poribacteria bacterium]|nr:zf-HC2 domain-containing protein [Candidatus Poribacteria bacterium]
MNCLQMEENFSSYFEDTLDFNSLQIFEEHLEYCEACQKEYKLFRESVSELQQLPQDVPSPDFLSTLQQQLSQEQPAAISFWRRLYTQFVTPKWALSGGFVMVLAITGMFLYPFNFGNVNNTITDTLSKTTQSVDDKSNSVIVEESGTQSNRQTLRNNQTHLGTTFSGFSHTVSGKPMQRRYVLKQVSYSTPVTGGGL